MLQQGKFGTNHLTSVLPKQLSVGNFVWVWHNYLLVQLKDAASTCILNLTSPGTDSLFQKNVIYKTFSIVYLNDE